MQYRTIGKTGLRVSEIGFGCGNNAVLMVKAPHEDQVKAVRHALDAGINFFDTAFAYGLGKSEENLGRILHELGAEPVVSTKIRLEADAVADVRAATVRAVEAWIIQTRSGSSRLCSTPYAGDIGSRDGQAIQSHSERRARSERRHRRFQIHARSWQGRIFWL